MAADDSGAPRRKMRIAQAARVHGVAERTIRHWVQVGKLDRLGPGLVDADQVRLLRADEHYYPILDEVRLALETVDDPALLAGLRYVLAAHGRCRQIARDESEES